MPSLNLFKEYIILHFHQGKWLLLTSITQWWSSNLFVVFSGLFLGVEMLGAFRLVQSLFGILNLILQTFENFVLPEAARKLVESKEIAKKYLLRISLKSSIIFGGMLAILFFFSSDVIQLVGGEQYVPYSFIVKGMVFLYVFIFLGYPIRIAIRILVLNKVFFTGYLLSFVFSLITFYFLLSEFEMNGAIIGLISAQVVTLGYWQFVLKKHNFILWK
jgi:O-antigen/teichoic acid export membrane protein